MSGTSAAAGALLRGSGPRRTVRCRPIRESGDG